MDQPEPRPTNAAILFEAEAYSAKSPRLMGRQAAGEAFLRAFLRHAAVDCVCGYVAGEPQAQEFRRVLREMGGQRPVRTFAARHPAQLAEIGCLFTPEPGIARHAWRRRRFGATGAYSLCGITHTTATHAVMDAVAEWLSSPVEAWDAVICTSDAVRRLVLGIVESQAAYLRERLGAAHFTLPQLPVIPLGVDCDAFRFAETTRQDWRQRLQIEAEDIAILFVGRLSTHAKAHPLPMYQALETAVAQAKPPGRVHLIQAGWFANAAIERVFREGARRLCPSVNAIFLDGRAADVRSGVWAAADLFTSLSDSIQETFGLTPVEAMAAGLPAVVTDWDGYKETVRDGLDGFRVPTLLPPPVGDDIADRYAAGLETYDLYLGITGQFVAVDLRAAASAYARLITDGDLRRRMGNSAQLRARDSFDWSAIIRRYQDLWTELAQLRPTGAATPEPGDAGVAPPARPDPFALFQNYATTVLAHSSRLALSAGATDAPLEGLLATPSIDFIRAYLPPLEHLAAILERLKRVDHATVGELLRLVPAEHHAASLRGLVWLCKFGRLTLLRR